MALNYYQYAYLDFISLCKDSIQEPTLFELSTAWHESTSKYMLKADEQVVIHCLFDEEAFLLAWPLIHEKSGSKRVLSSLSSFYSALTSPLLGKALSAADIEYYFAVLLSNIKKRNKWSHILLGPLEQSFYQQISLNSRYVKVFSYSDNWLVENITDFDSYYDKRPSQLKNTIKRKEKKLSKEHSFFIKMVTSKEEFDCYFADYQRIYELSWKGEETSFEFIKKVCEQAIEENKLRMGILFVNEQAVAAQLWFLQQGTASIFKLAYDPAYKAYSVGSILSMAMSKYVIETDKINSIEFGMGSEAYKKDWMDKKRQRVTMQVFNERSFLGILLAVRHILFAKLKRLIIKNNEG